MIPETDLPQENSSETPAAAAPEPKGKMSAWRSRVWLTIGGLLLLLGIITVVFVGLPDRYKTPSIHRSLPRLSIIPLPSSTSTEAPTSPTPTIVSSSPLPAADIPPIWSKVQWEPTERTTQTVSKWFSADRVTRQVVQSYVTKSAFLTPDQLPYSTYFGYYEDALAQRGWQASAGLTGQGWDGGEQQGYVKGDHYFLVSIHIKWNGTPGSSQELGGYLSVEHN